MGTDEELLAEIRDDLDRDDEACHKPGTCGACIYFSAKIFYGGLGDADKGKCFGWIEDDKDETGFSVPRWKESTDTCNRYTEDKDRLDLLKQTRLNAERVFLERRKRNQNLSEEFIGS